MNLGVTIQLEHFNWKRSFVCTMGLLSSWCEYSLSKLGMCSDSPWQSNFSSNGFWYNIMKASLYVLFPDFLIGFLFCFIILNRKVSLYPSWSEVQYCAKSNNELKKSTWKEYNDFCLLLLWSVKSGLFRSYFDQISSLCKLFHNYKESVWGWKHQQPTITEYKCFKLIAQLTSVQHYKVW